VVPETGKDFLYETKGAEPGAPDSPEQHDEEGDDENDEEEIYE